MTDREKYALYRIGNILLQHPERIDKNVQLLNNMNVFVDDCKTGPGIDEIAIPNLDEKITCVDEMGYMEEILDKSDESLEIIRATSMKLDYKNYMSSLDNKYKKEVA